MQASSSTFGPLVDAAWLADHLSDVVVCDVRWYLDGRSGRGAYDAGHIPSAHFVDLDIDLSGRAGGVAGRHPLPEPRAFAAVMSGLGIGDGTPVVAYDDTGGSTASRLVWMLRALGEPAALLDGGIGAWTGPLSVGPPSTERPPATTPSRFTPRAWPSEAIVDADRLSAELDDAAVIAIDARAGERYRGEVEPVDPRAGHIPGAQNLPWLELVDPETRRFRSPAELRERLAAVGASGRKGGATEVVAYCGSGVTACVAVLAVEIAGLAPARLFVSSWSGWSADPERRAATGSEAGGTAR